MPTCNFCKTGPKAAMNLEAEFKRIREDDGILFLEAVVVHRCHKCNWLTHKIVDSERVF